MGTSAQGQAWLTPDAQVDHHHGTEPNMPENVPETSEPAEAAVKKTHACKACRQMKVRCELTDDSSPCRRCLKAERRCESVQTPSRKRRSRPASRVAQLEKKIDALTASLGGRTSQDDSTTATAQGASTKDGDESRTLQVAEARLDQNVSGIVTHSAHPTLNRGLPASGVDDIPVEFDTADQSFNRYRQEMSRYIPVVMFPVSMQIEDIRSRTPILFLSVITAAAAIEGSPEQHRVLVTALTRALAEAIFCRGQRSLELVQALLLLSIFYQPPMKQRFMTQSHLCHTALLMAFDIGLCKKSTTSRSSVGKKGLPADQNEVEERRTWIGCYYMCSNSAIALRRPALIRWSSYIEESLEVLAMSPNALPSDEWLSHLIRIQRIAEETTINFGIDESTITLPLTDSKVQYHLKASEGLLKAWHEHALGNQSDIPEPLIQHLEATNSLYVHELALHNAYNVDDFKLQPVYEIRPETSFEDDGPDVITPAHIESLRICLRSVHKVFDAFLAMDLQLLRALPTLFVVKNNYAVVALIKMYGATVARGGKLRSIFQTSDLRLGYYLDAIYKTLSKMAEGNHSPVAERCRSLFAMLKTRYQKDANLGTLSSNALGPGPESQLPHPTGSRESDHVNLYSGPAFSTSTAPSVLADEGFTNEPNFAQTREAFPTTSANVNDTSFSDFEGVNFNDFFFNAEDLNAMGDFTDVPWWNTSQGGGWAI